MLATTFVIAEAGVNHNGSLDLALRLVDAAAAAGADAVKFQTFKSSALTAHHAPRAAYQERTVGVGSQVEMLRRLELSPEAHERLRQHATSCGLTFLSTPFDLESLRFLVELGVPRLKLSSGDLTNLPLLRAVGGTGLPVVLSTGMSMLGDVEAALGGLTSGALAAAAGGRAPSCPNAFASREGRRWLEANVVLLHCTTEYPTPLEEVNLRAMDTLAAAFGLPVGYSDHTQGIVVPLAAVARGAVLVEKHFTLDRTMSGPDHAASLEPGQLGEMVRGIREVERALGSARKVPSPSEARNVLPARRSLVAARPIVKGELFTEENLVAKRPGNGISPMRIDEWIGRAASRDYEADELID
jgi:N-acetylneuraminate synthase